MREVTPSSQAKKSDFEVSIVICDTIGRALDTILGVTAGELDGLGGVITCQTSGSVCLYDGIYGT
jgi:hypothetical protein